MYQYHTLNNGIRIIYKQTDSIVTHSGVYIAVGSRHESQSDQGIAHFIEHSIFKGTTHRRASHILNRIDGVGGELNAFTTKEETCIYASSLSIHLDRCLQLFADILFNSTFPVDEIEKEKDVVIEEINSYKDTPSELIFDDFEEYIFQGHPLAHNILGTKKNVRHFTSERLLGFFKTNYTPSRMVITIVGSAPFSRVVNLCNKFFVGMDRPDAPQTETADTPDYRHFNLSLNRHTHSSHILAGCRAPSIPSPHKTAFALLNNIIGGPAMNSRLNIAIREKRGFCYTVESQYTPFSDAGLFYVYAGIDRGANDRYLDLLFKELRRLGQTPLTTSQLRAAQQQYTAQIAIANESGLTEMQSIGKSMLSFDTVDTLQDMRRDIEAVTSGQIVELAREYLNPDNMSILCYS